MPSGFRRYGADVRRGLTAALCSLLAVTVVTTTAAGARKPAPPIAGTTLEGKRLALRDLRGKPVIINVWSSW